MTFYSFFNVRHSEYCYDLWDENSNTWIASVKTQGAVDHVEQEYTRRQAWAAPLIDVEYAPAAWPE